MYQGSDWRNKVKTAWDNLLTSYLLWLDPWQIPLKYVALQMELEGTGLLDPMCSKLRWSNPTAEPA